MSGKIGALKQLEAEAIHIIREVAATAKHPVLLYSVGKDSSTILHLAKKAFAPAPIPFPVMQIYTGYQFPEMITFRDKMVKKYGVDLIVQQNTSSQAMTFGPEETHADQYIYHKKTKPLLDGLTEHGFDMAIGGARREEEKARAKERVFSVRQGVGGWNPKDQRPELWHMYNTSLKEDQTMRVFPISNWTEADIWAYILEENIEVVPLYFAAKRKVVKRYNTYIRLDEFTKAKDGEEIFDISCRYRTLGCAPSTGAVPSTATTVEEILEEVIQAELSERQNRAIDYTSDASMEQKKKEGYF